MRGALLFWIGIGLVLILGNSYTPGLASPLPQEATPTAFVPPTVQQPPTATPVPTATVLPGGTPAPTPRARVALPTVETIRDAALRGALLALAGYGLGLMYLLTRTGLRALLRLRHRRLRRPSRHDALRKA